MEIMAQKPKRNEYRVTRPELYPPGSPGHENPAGRQGHYVLAHSEEEALESVRERFPGEALDVELWQEEVF